MMSLQDAIALGKKLGRKFVDDDLETTPELRLVAVEYIKKYKGNFSYMKDLQTREVLSPAQLRGALNVALNEARWEEEQSKREQTIKIDFKDRSITPTFYTPEVPNGTYTIDFGGDYVTIRLDKCKLKGLPEGTQIASYLAGPDNESDFVGFAFVQGETIKLWRKFEASVRLARGLKALLSEDPAPLGEAYALRSGNCYRCGRKLTVPFSIYRGLGPICAGRE